MTRMLERSDRSGQTHGNTAATAVEFSHPEAHSPTAMDNDRVVPSTTPFLV
ncbi:MAG TPA: hypothetical protein VK204_14075 [Nocardioidaceae bacterium]|nr:hypothetical protein [Nocardioidaceae bacterium]